MTCHDPDRLPVEAFELPSSAVVDQLLDAYFTHVNPGFPVIDQNLFLQQYSARDPQNPPSLLLLHAILVVGAHVLYDNNSAREVMKATFFRRAKSLFDARFERNRDVIVQAALLLSWHADGPEDVAANAWYWVGIAARTAMGLGMHRNADESTIVPHNKRMWRRVWWLLFQCDVYLSLQYGRPQAIRLEECDVGKLQLSDFQDCGPNTQAIYVMQSTELCIIMSHGLREKFRLASTPQSRQRELKSLDQSLAQWSLHLPETLHMRAGLSVNLWSASIQLHYNMVLLLLHRPRPNQAPTREDTEICAMAAGFIQSIFQDLCAHKMLRCLWISIINCIFTALIQLSIEVRTSSPIVALPSLMRYDATLSSFRQLSEYWPNARPILHFFESVRSSKRKDNEKPESSTDTFLQDVTADQAMSTSPASDPKPPLESTTAVLSVHDGIEIMDEQGQVSVEDAIIPGDEGAFPPVTEMIDSWHEWRDANWQGDLANDFLFTF